FPQGGRLMKSLFRILLPAAALAAVLAPSANAHGHGYGGGLIDEGQVVLSRPIGLFFEAHMGGYTLYAREAGSGVASASDYSHIHYTPSPAQTAQAVVNRLREFGIPAVPPETRYLWKNPRAAEGVLLPIPRTWIKKDKDEKPKKDEEKK